MRAPMLLFDGDCAFCSRCAEAIERRVATSATITPWQLAPLERLGLTAEECARAVQWVGVDGRRTAGAAAIADLLSNSSSRRWRAAGRALRTAPLRALAAAVYGVVARNRYRLPGGTAACTLPAARPHHESDYGL